MNEISNFSSNLLHVKHENFLVDIIQASVKPLHVVDSNVVIAHREISEASHGPIDLFLKHCHAEMSFTFKSYNTRQEIFSLTKFSCHWVAEQHRKSPKEWDVSVRKETRKCRNSRRKSLPGTREASHAVREVSPTCQNGDSIQPMWCNCWASSCSCRTCSGCRRSRDIFWMQLRWLSWPPCRLEPSRLWRFHRPKQPCRVRPLFQRWVRLYSTQINWN